MDCASEETNHIPSKGWRKADGKRFCDTRAEKTKTVTDPTLSSRGNEVRKKLSDMFGVNAPQLQRQLANWFHHELAGPYQQGGPLPSFVLPRAHFWKRLDFDDEAS
eukprot:5231073-Prymnesium_polylepis.1